MQIVVDDLSGPQIAEFLDEHVQEMRAITPLESKHALDLDGLRGPGITFWSVLDGDTLVGCGALKPSRLLEHILAEARRIGYTRVSLETGSAEFFRPARSLYEKFGFGYCEPFADYRLDPHSVFMTRVL